MISTSQAYREAITGDRRRVGIRAIVDLAGPDIVYGTAVSSGESPYSRSEQLHDKIFALGTPYATLEHNRWILDGSFDVAPPDEETQVGFESAGLFDENGEGRLYVEQPFSGLYILQACSVYFPDNDYDGYPVDFTVEVRQGGTAYYTREFTGNTERSVFLEGFTVHNPDAIRVTATRWSLPWRRMRVPEIVPGIYEVWTERDIGEMSVVQQGNFSTLSLPYGTYILSMDNSSRRFEPRRKNVLFQSIEERQAIDIALSVWTESGDEYVPLGLGYQYNGGWKPSDNSLSMTWSLVDIIGLLQGRLFAVPEVLPTTLESWIALLVSQLGVNFAQRYTVDPDYAELPCTVLSRDALDGKKCGQILLWVCQATSTWPRADAETGKLAVEPFWSQGNVLSLDNLTAYPGLRANNDIARLDFTLSDGTALSIPGTSSASPNTQSVQNPFLHTADSARKAAQMILSAYGGNQIENTGRGDPSSEIGDVTTVQLDESSATTGRLAYQTFRFSNRVLQGCQSRLIQPAGWEMYQQRVLLTKSGTFAVPAGVTSLALAIGQGGQAGFDGTNASFSKAGEAGADGSGGQIWYGAVGVNPGATFAYSIGAGGKANGAMGEHSSFGPYNSSNGSIFPNGYTDIQGGDSFGRSGVTAPAAGTSDGGKGGSGGYKGSQHTETYTSYRYYYTDESGSTREISKAEYDRLYSEGYAARLSRQSYSGTRTVTDAAATKGGTGAPGASGFVLIYYNQN